MPHDEAAARSGCACVRKHSLAEENCGGRMAFGLPNFTPRRPRRRLLGAHAQREVAEHEPVRGRHTGHRGRHEVGADCRQQGRRREQAGTDQSRNGGDEGEVTTGRFFISRRGFLSHAEGAEVGSHKEHKEHKDDFGAGVSPQFTCQSLRRQDPECELVDLVFLGVGE